MSGYALVGDRLHTFPAHEECNLDDSAKVEKIDEGTAATLLEHSQVTPCEHCKPWPEGQLLDTRGPADRD